MLPGQISAGNHVSVQIYAGTSGISESRTTVTQHILSKIDNIILRSSMVSVTVSL